jgi:hypothetical protein
MNQLTLLSDVNQVIDFDFFEHKGNKLEEFKEELLGSYEQACEYWVYDEGEEQLPTLSVIGDIACRMYVEEIVFKCYADGSIAGNIDVRENIDEHQCDQLDEIQDSIHDEFHHNRSFGMGIGNIRDYFNDIEKLLNLCNLTYRKDDDRANICNVNSHVVEVW